ncbi:MAG: hypothetical protein KF794_04450 [Xanthobacteraceae bacterium]|nr:hypothetical protein [Xanthobacteraceae bacterium]QYK45950.1 MAG: hypothetical protein KF794_04450 [Xanthobacteraceae bacterium]
MRFPPVGRCVYCGSTDQLSDEHIVPISLGGDIVLPNSSCENCRLITSRFEQVVARDMLWRARLKLKIPGNRKRKNKKRTHWPMLTIGPGDIEQTKNIPVGDIPLVMSIVKMPPPGIISGRPPSEIPTLQIRVGSSPSEIAKFQNDYQATPRFEMQHNQLEFNQTLAKIGHCAVAAVVGLDGYEPLLIPFIKGERTYENSYYYIGGISSDDEVLKDNQLIGVTTVEHNNEKFVVSRVTIFGKGLQPTYLVIVGRVTDRTLVSKRLNLAAPP